MEETSALLHDCGRRAQRRKRGGSYPQPTPPFEALAGYVAVYPGKMDACLLDGERVTPQPGDYYGGWITHEIVGPFKGEPGTLHW
jgi:hypothetical protein